MAMSVEQFEASLREQMYRDPFVPFVVETADGRTYLFTEPRLVFGGGAASRITPDGDWDEFACEDVVSIHPVQLRRSS